MLSEPTTAAEVIARARQTVSWRKSLAPKRVVETKPVSNVEIKVEPTAPPVVPAPLTTPKFTYEMACKLADIARRPVSSGRLTEDIDVQRPSIRFIQEFVASKYGCSVNDLKSATRNARITMVRQIGFYITRKLTLHSFPEIGRRYGGRDHTTALHGFQKVSGMAEALPTFATELAELCQALLAAYAHYSGPHGASATSTVNSVGGGAETLPALVHIIQNETSRHGVLPTPAGSSATA